jgi:hypothetical protein
MATVVNHNGMSVKQSNTSCQTCGHTSHCGSNATMNIKDYACDGGEIREVVICKHCNCTKCQKFDSGTPKNN